MAEASNQQRETTVQMDNTPFGANLEVAYMDADPSAEMHNTSEELTVPRSAGNFADEIEEFIPAVRRYCNNFLGRELSTDEEETFRMALPVWNTFLQSVQQGMLVGVPGATAAIISSDINEDINVFILWQQEQLGAQWPNDSKRWIQQWLRRWNMSLQARAGVTKREPTDYANCNKTGTYRLRQL